MTVPPAVQPFSWHEPPFSTTTPVEDLNNAALALARQRNAVMNHLMNIALGDPQVHRRLRVNQDFQAALSALDPEKPTFLEDERLRKMLQIGCFQMIDNTAAVLRFARENNFQLVP